MAAELDAEAKNDGELYDKLACWCETNDKDKTKAIGEAKAIREKQNDEFNMTEKDLIQSIHSLK